MSRHQAPRVANGAVVKTGFGEEREKEDAIKVAMKEVATIDATVGDVVELAGLERTLSTVVTGKTWHEKPP